MIHLPNSIVKLKIQFLNYLDFFLNHDDFELRELTQLKQSSNNYEEWMRADWNLRAKYDPFYFVRSIKNQSKGDFWQSGYFDRDSILEKDSVQKILGKNFENTSALEIGCGVGRILIPMSEKFHKVVGVDISNEMIKIGKQKTKKQPNCEFLVSNGKDLIDLPSSFFNFCYSFIVFQHIPDKEIVKNYIKDVHRVLKPNSCFCFQVKGMCEIDPIKFRLLDKINDKKSDSHDTWFGVQFSSKEMHEIADEFRFKVIEESGENTEYYWLTFVKK